MAKKTKVDYFQEILEVEGLSDELKEFVQNLIDKDVAAKAKAAERRAAKAAEKGPDAMGEAVLGALTKDFQLVQDIYDAIADKFDEISLPKVRARLTALVKAGKATKEQVEIEEGEKVKKAMAYALAN